LVAEYGSLIENIVAKPIWCFDFHRRGDVSQVILIALTKALPSFAVQSTLRTFISRIAHHKCVDEVRKKARREAHEYLFDEDLADGDPVREWVDHRAEGPLDQLIRSERVAMARELVEELGPRCREILLLRYQQDLKYKEIQERLNIPMGTVGKRLSSCLERARKTMGESSFERE
jgi:RNA polymerase sigma-70 factor (ECF subfamily)